MTIKKGKAKIKKAILKRFRVTKNGKVLHRSNNIRHQRGAKGKARIRRLKTTKSLFKTMAKKVKIALQK